MSQHLFTSLRDWFPEHDVFPLFTQNFATATLSPNFTHNNTSSPSLEREVTQITTPEILVVKPVKPNGFGVLIIPGGSYKRVAFDKEGVDTAKVLSDKGYTVFVMTYRMPADGHSEGNLVSLADAQRAMRLIRSQQEKWKLKHLGVIGFSAGGHVASSLATRYSLSTYKPTNDIDNFNARPDFVTLMYPVISMDLTIGHPGSRHELLGAQPAEYDLFAFSNETHVSPQTPPCMLIHAVDDPAVKVENSVVFWQALKAHHVPVEMHLFERGGHGFGIRDTIGLPVETWPNLFDAWVKNLQLVTRT